MAQANTVKFTAGSSGTSDFSDGTAVTGFRNLSGASLTVGATYSYRAVSSDLSQWENGSGVWSGTTLSRATIYESSTGSKINFTAAPVVSLTPLKADFDEKSDDEHRHGATEIDYESASPTQSVGEVLDSLGDAAFKDAGTGADQVSAGDHDHAGVYEPADATILKDADIGVTLQGFDALLQDIADLTDPGGDRSLGWDDSAGQIDWFTYSTGFSISGTTITVQAASTTQAGIAEIATSAEWRTGTDTTRSLGVAETWGAMAEVSLSDSGGAIAWNMASGFDFTITLDGNHAFSNPSNVKVGQKGRLRIVQDGTGNRVPTWGTSFEFAGAAAPTLSTGAADQDVLYYDAISSTRILISSPIADIS